ncbi:uncharacterized protein LOC100888991 [Strongylocentrotus purpuratus]|uniref:CUB domain-containing protein n=1 Tax=Strongylocentrotus purpuratus TaxID=7668 RepID=A0A7M7LL77_STRPU|nr:uncharacterized protein LOC100888991 [Strongylocentrotus purpuratus]
MLTSKQLFVLCLVNVFFVTVRGSTNTVVLTSVCDASLQKEDASFLVTSATYENITGPEDCTVVIQALKSNQMLAVVFVSPFLLEDDENNPLLPDGQGCRRSSLMIWDGDDYETDDLIGRYCGTETPASFESTGQFLTIWLSLNESAAANISVLYTSFDNGVCDDDVTELRCNNGRCVPRSVSCDLANNCGDNSDQLISAPAYCSVTDESTLAESYPWLWILLGILGVLLLAYILYWLLWRPGYIIWRLGCCRNLWYGCCRGVNAKCCGQSRKYNKGSRSGTHGSSQDGVDYYDTDDDDDGESTGCLCCRCCRSCSSNDKQRRRSKRHPNQGSDSSMTQLHRPGLYKEGVMFPPGAGQRPRLHREGVILPPDAGDRPKLHREGLILPPDAIRPSLYKEDLIIPQYGPRPQLYKEGVILPPPEEQGRVQPMAFGIYHEDTIVPPPSTLVTPSLVMIEDCQKDWDGRHAREAR